ncbi:MAG: phosphosulfolactate synthase [Acidimicrobiia bacterium]|nr:phosphosulfolactate synthase [Acidimicrobiia bacterium]MYD04341.1 phosphosulfolactate synthase [Acidimicrobiia bacterium]
MVIDTGVGLGQCEDLLAMADRWIDHWKISFGTSALVPKELLTKKLNLIGSAGILTFPGGTMFEATIVRRHCRPYMRSARGMGFTAVEISEGSIDLSPDRRRGAIECGLDHELTVITEVGKKDPSAQPSPEQLADQALQDLEWGAAWVVIEGRESGTGVGVYDEAGGIDTKAVETIAERMGDQADRLVWEAPLKDQQAMLIGRFGINVGLGNINPARILALEALRTGLRFETLRPIATRLAAKGQWDPTTREPDL